MSEPRFGFIYRHAWIYQMAMRLLYRSHYKRKYQLVADEIPAGSSVVDLCCGDCQIYPLLEAKGCRYTGLDINSRFIEWGKNKGLDVRHWDGLEMDIPEADVVCIQSALYHFMPNERRLLDLMMKRARKRVIIAEPVDTWTELASNLVHNFAVRMTQVHGRTFTERHSEDTLNALLAHLPPEKITKRRMSRELIIVISK